MGTNLSFRKQLRCRSRAWSAILCPDLFCGPSAVLKASPHSLEELRSCGLSFGSKRQTLVQRLPIDS